MDKSGYTSALDYLGHNKRLISGDSAASGFALVVDEVYLSSFEDKIRALIIIKEITLLDTSQYNSRLPWVA